MTNIIELVSDESFKLHRTLEVLDSMRFFGLVDQLKIRSVALRQPPLVDFVSKIFVLLLEAFKELLPVDVQEEAF